MITANKLEMPITWAGSSSNAYIIQGIFAEVDSAHYVVPTPQ